MQKYTKMFYNTICSIIKQLFSIFFNLKQRYFKIRSYVNNLAITRRLK